MAHLSLTLALTPAGTLVLREATDADPIDPATAERIRAALARGAGACRRAQKLPPAAETTPFPHVRSSLASG